jgi:hypothetical protein
MMELTSRGKVIVRDMKANPTMGMAVFQEHFGVTVYTLKKHCGMGWSQLREELGLPKLKHTAKKHWRSS